MSRVVTTIPVGGTLHCVALADRRKLIIDAITGRRRGPFVYVANVTDRSVSVIRLTDNSVVKTIQSIDVAGKARAGANGARVYVLGLHGVTVIDTATQDEIQWIPFAGEQIAISFDVTKDGSKLYVGDFGAKVSVVDAKTSAVIATIPVSSVPGQVELSPDGSRAYTANTYGNDVSVIDTATHTIVDTIEVGAYAQSLAVSPDNARVYVTHGQAQKAIGELSVIDTTTNSVTASITVGNGAAAVALSPNGKRAYVTNWLDNTVSIINTDTNKVAEAVTVGQYPNGVAVALDGKLVYVSNADGSVSAIGIESPVAILINKHITDLLTAAHQNGGGWIVLGNKVVPIPPQSPSLAIAAKTAAAHFDGAVDGPEIAEQLRRLSNRGSA